MKLIFTIFSIFTFKLFYCQEIKILDFNSNQPIENVSVSIDENFIGYSDSHGNFQIKEDIKYSSISFSHLSYETLSIEKEQFNESIIYLISKSETLDEVEIEAKKKYNVRRAIFGGLGASAGSNFGWNTKVVTFIPFEYEGKITTLTYQLVDMLGVKGLKYLKFKANLYSIDTLTRLPKQKLIEEDILTSNKNGDRVYSLDVSKYNIQMPKEGVFVAFVILDYDEYVVKHVMSKGGLMVATPAIKTRTRKNKEKRFSLKYTKKSHDHKLINKWIKNDDNFYVMGLEIN
ncbi:hypothetical protein [Psychroserpens mesophilus]|uniref:hypothetical protein n=1 Tax=Psychroserpens mesophilus TaxID=325473 RepID=UPI003D65D74C